MLEHPEARTNGGGPSIDEGLAWNPYPDPEEEQGGNLEESTWGWGIASAPFLMPLSVLSLNFEGGESTKTLSKRC